MALVMEREEIRATEPITQGSYISSARKKLGLSQKDLANQIKHEDEKSISPQYLNDLERDRRQLTSDHLIKQFAALLNLDGAYLHYLAGKFPTDIVQKKLSESDFKAKFVAFRRS